MFTNKTRGGKPTLLHYLRVGILLYFLAVGASFVFLIPVGQAPDEPSHLAFINFVAVHGHLPNQYMPSEFVRDEGHQPPLYYILGAMLVRASNGGHAYAVNVTYVETPGPVPLLSGTFADGKAKLAFMLLRCFSLLCGAGIVVLIFKIAELFFPDSLWQAIPALFAVTLPQFLFNCAYINNDVLSNLLTTAAIFYSFKILAGSPRRADFVLMGVCTGLSFCTKKTGLFLFPCIFACLCWAGVRDRWGLRGFATRLAYTFGAVLLVSSLMLIRNRLLYGDWLATQMEQRSLEHLIARKTLRSHYFREEFPFQLYTSFIGRFGWMIVPLPERIYTFYTLLLRITGAGVFLCLVQRIRLMQQSKQTGSSTEDGESLPDRYQATLVCAALGYVACCFTGIVVFNLTYTQAQGRYWFCVLACIGVLVAVGAKTVYTILAQGHASRSVQAGLGVAAVLVLVGVDVCALLTLHNYYR